MFFNLTLIILTICCVKLLLNQKQHKIIDKYGNYNCAFWTFTYSYKSALNPTFVAIYNNHIVISIWHKETVINTENILDFNYSTFFKPASLKFKTNDIYKIKTIRFSFIRKEQCNTINNFISKFKD